MINVEDIRKVGNQLYNVEYSKQRIQVEITSISPAMLKNISRNVDFQLKNVPRISWTILRRDI
jgi:hypothetical protein